MLYKPLQNCSVKEATNYFTPCTSNFVLVYNVKVLTFHRIHINVHMGCLCSFLFIIFKIL